MSTDNHQKPKHIASAGTRAVVSSSLSSLSSSCSSPVYGSTPGAISPFSMTPRGTRIMYERQFLLDCRNSPLARSPLQNLPNIPGVTCDLDVTVTVDVTHANKPASKKHNKRSRNGSRKKRTSPEDVAEEHQFQLDL